MLQSNVVSQGPLLKSWFFHLIMCDLHKLTPFRSSFFNCKMRVIITYQIHRVAVVIGGDDTRGNKYEVTDILLLEPGGLFLPKQKHIQIYIYTVSCETGGYWLEIFYCLLLPPTHHHLFHSPSPETTPKMEEGYVVETL